MKRKLLSFLLALCLTLLLPLSVGAEESGDVPPTPDGITGSGTAEDPYLIGDAVQFRAFATSVGSESNYTGEYVQLTGDIDLGNIPLTPISSAFSGTFDGAGYTISNLTIKSNQGFVGLFGKIGDGATVKNLFLADADIAADHLSGRVGAFTSQLDGGRLINCAATGTVRGTAKAPGSDAVGGLVGKIVGSGSTLQNCYFLGDVIPTKETTAHGALVGRNEHGTIQDCYFVGESTDTGIGASTGTVNTAPSSTAYLRSAAFARQLNENLLKIDTDGDGEGDGDGYQEWAQTFGLNNELPYLTTASPRLSDWNDDSSGDGSEENPFQIATEAQLRVFAQTVNDGISFDGFHVKLMNDISLTSEWTPIGGNLFDTTDAENPIRVYFEGVFDGGNHKIKGLQIGTEESPATEYSFAGLFGIVFRGGVKNLAVYSDGIFVNAASSSNGVLVGKLSYGEISGCYTTGDISVSHEQGATGGLVGLNDGGYIRNCYTTGDIIGAPLGSTGGLAGCVYSTGSVDSCYASGLVTLAATEESSGGNAGGLVGENPGNTITNSYYNSANAADVSTSGTAKTLAEMKSANFLALLNGESDPDIWAQSSVKNSGRPYLAANPPADDETALPDVPNVTSPSTSKTTVTPQKNGSTTIVPASPKKGEAVTLRPAPDEGFAIGDITIRDRNGGKISFKDNGDGTYTFTHPGNEIIIEVTFLPLDAFGGLPFTDVRTTDWFYGAVKHVYENSIMNGSGGGEFDPGNKLNRSMMVQILWNLAGNPAAGSSSFSDVQSSNWFASAVAWAAESGIVKGIGGNLFAPNQEITREQMVVMLYNYCVFAGIELPTVREGGSFADADDVSIWAAEAVQSMYEAGILNGKGNGAFDPQGTATRAEVAQMLMSFMEAAK